MRLRVGGMGLDTPQPRRALPPQRAKCAVRPDEQVWMGGPKARERKEMQTDLFGSPAIAAPGMAKAPRRAEGRKGAGRRAFAEAMRDARDIREWTDGPNPSDWRVGRLAQALCDGR